MAERVALTGRDRAILAALTMRVRCLTLDQIQRHWWPDATESSRGAEARLRRLTQDGLLASSLVHAGVPMILTAPLVVVPPGGPAPEFGALAYHLKFRFRDSARAMRIYYGMRRAAAIVGGQAGRPPRPAESTHDLALANVYLHFSSAAPERAAGWRGEAALVAEWGGEPGLIPDALVVEPDGRQTAIELAGEYEVVKLTRFHDYCRERGWGYELW